MLELNDKTLFIRPVAEAHFAAHGDHARNRRINAIAKAATLLEGDLTFLDWKPFDEVIFYWSADSGEIYRISDAECQCPAFSQSVPRPCYRRAMRGIAARYFVDESGPGHPNGIDFADTVFFDAEMNARQKIELLRDSNLDGRAELKPRVAFLENHLNSSKPVA